MIMRRISARLGPGLVQVVFGLIAVLGLATTVLQLSTATTQSEAGYGDSYILYDVVHYQRTGVIYRDLSEPPYLPAQYSPPLYMLLSLPDRVLQHPNKFLGPRVVVIGAFIGCIIASISITRALMPGAAAAVWALGLALSVAVMSNWLLQLRADFLGILCNLISIRLLIAQRRRAVLLAGLLAGGAVLFKFTLVAAGVAGVLWLGFQRRWIDAVYFVAAAAIMAGVPYVAYGLYEPRMLPQILALSPGLADIRGSVRLVPHNEPLIALILAGIPAALAGADPRRTAVMIFCLISVIVAAATAVQAGANVNYYFEFYLGAIPIGVLGLLHLNKLSRHFIAVGLVTAFLLTDYVIRPRIRGLRLLASTVSQEAARNEALGSMQQILSRHHTLSTIPRLAIMDPAPTLVEPYLLSYLVRLKKIDPAPLIADVASRSFEGILTHYPAGASWRGVSHIEEPLKTAISRSYVPACVYQGPAEVPFVLHLPAGVSAADSPLAQDLSRIGCWPLSD